MVRAVDPSGTVTGSTGDITTVKKGNPTVDELAAETGHTKMALNFVWLLITGFLVIFMQAGFAMVEGGTI